MADLADLRKEKIYYAIIQPFYKEIRLPFEASHDLDSRLFVPGYYCRHPILEDRPRRSSFVR